jgi:hypothetical protein
MVVDTRRRPCQIVGMHMLLAALARLGHAFDDAYPGRANTP